MFSKVILGLTLLSAVSFVKSNDLRLGQANGYSQRIFSEIKEANPALWKRTDDLVINVSDPNSVISGIFITDLRDDKDGEAFIESGGIGTKSVTIGLKSPTILRGYKFEIQVFSDNSNARYFSKGGDSLRYQDDAQYARKY